VNRAPRLSREDGADMNFAYAAKLSGAISVAEFIGWVERVLAVADTPLPDYVYDLSYLSPDIATTSDLNKIIPNVSGNLTEGEDKVLMSISVIRDPKRVNKSDESRPSTPKLARKILEKYPHATRRFETFFPGLLS